MQYHCRLDFLPWHLFASSSAVTESLEGSDMPVLLRLLLRLLLLEDDVVRVVADGVVADAEEEDVPPREEEVRRLLSKFESATIHNKSSERKLCFSKSKSYQAIS
jgi:hypothetical protein